MPIKNYPDGVIAANTKAIGKKIYFLVKKNLDQSNIATSTVVKVTFVTEIVDNYNNFSSSTFTAPSDGMYQLSYCLDLRNIDQACTDYTISLKTSNRTYYWLIEPHFLSDLSYLTVPFSILVDMDFSDTAYIDFWQGAGTQQTDIDETGTFFSGYLVAEY